MEIVTTLKPWGSFKRFTLNEPSTVKLLYINSGEELSLQYHNKRGEFWKVVKGHPHIVIGDKSFEAKEGDEFDIAVAEKHRIGAPTDNVIIMEISKGDFSEEDIVRLEDKYKR